MGSNDINYQDQNPAGPANGFSGNMNPEPIKQKKKFPVLPVSIGVGVVALIAIIAVVLLKSGLFMTDQQKVFLAVSNTLSEDPVLAPFSSITKVTESDAATVDLSMKMDPLSMTVTSAADTGKGQFSLDGTVEYYGTNVAFKGLLDDTSLRLAFPDINNKVLEYDYTRDNNGFLKEQLEASYGPGALDHFNKMLSSYVSILKKSQALHKNFEKKMGKALEGVKTKKTGSKDCQIGGKDQSCDEYTMTLTENNIRDIVEAYFDAENETCGQEMKDIKEALEALGADSSSMDMDQMKDQILSQINMKDTDIHFYIKDNKLAALDTEYEGSKVKMEFRGGDRRTSDILLTVGEGESAASISKTDELSGKEDKGSISVDGEPVLDYTYNTDSGKFTISHQEEDYFGDVQSTEISGILKGSPDGLQFAIDSMDESFDMDLKLKEGARIEALTGDVFDLGNASQEDVSNVFEEISEAFGQY